jgi:pyruvate,water dikinase
VDEALPYSPSFVLPLEDIPWGTSHDVGGKNSKIAELKNQLGLNVPDGFALTTTAFDIFLKYNNLEGYIEQAMKTITSRETVLNELQNKILDGSFPSEISFAIHQALGMIRSRHGECLLAIRSSAEEEDGVHSFAGLFKTMLNVPASQENVERACREVIASLFSDKAVSYQQQTGYDIGSFKMAVGCLVMVDAVSSGVIYSISPEGGNDTMVINAAWGLGESVVEGKSGSDLYVVQKGREPILLQTTLGNKETMIVGKETGGTIEASTPEDLRRKPCLSNEQVIALANQAVAIERYFGSPQDIEWAMDKNGVLFILQSRPLKVQESTIQSEGILNRESISDSAHPEILHNRGVVVQRGTGAGKVFVETKPSDSMTLPKGAVLVAKHDSSLYVRIMPYVSAIITETGSPTSHMAALCRELKIPTIVNVPNAMDILKHGQDVTVVAGEDNKMSIYSGIIREVLLKSGQDVNRMDDIFEFRKKRYILRYLSPLNLIDPLMDEFTPERCRSMHDILRFMHEKAVAELVESARGGSATIKKHTAVTKLDLPVPAGILVMDMGGGLKPDGQNEEATFDQITSIPFRAIVGGMIYPGAWHSDAVALKTRDFLSSMMRMPDIVNATDSTVGYNVAIITREYVNMSIRFGYHFNMVDCYCSETPKNNHIYFRFAGGATDLTKRSRRLDLIARVLATYGFNIKIKGDLLIARLAGINQPDMEKILDQTGRLISFARQLDAVLHNGASVERYANNFFNGVYEL